MKKLKLALLIPVAICTAGGAVGVLSAAQPAGGTGGAPAGNMAPGQAASPGANTPGSAARVPGAGAAVVQPQTTAKASLVSAPGREVKGDLTVTAEGIAVLIRGEITGLTPDKKHGFHVHEFGECTAPDFKSAGEHFNPAKNPHGEPDARSRHLGDMPNAEADKNGRATINVRIEGATLVDKDGGPNAILGKSLVVHAMPDDFKTQPSGGSGDRIACGVIR